MSGGCGSCQIPNVHTRKPAFTPRTKRCQKRSKLLPRCCSSGTIQRSLTGGTSAAWRLRPTVRCSPVRSDLLAMRKRTKCTPTQRAAEYLKRVAALTGAEQVRGDSYWLRAGRRNFLVDINSYVLSHTTANRRAFLLRRTQTCQARKWLRLHYYN